jgi:predicted RNase H-like HicB family nuclease
MNTSLDQMRFEATLEAYVLCVEPVLLADGEWGYRADYPELAGVSTVSTTALGAINEVDRRRDEYIRSLLEGGEPVPAGWSSSRGLAGDR